MSQTTTEVFFRADPICAEPTTIPAALYNRCRLLLTRCQQPHLFVPIRSMQYLAVIDRDEVIFVDSQAYAVRNGEGGRMVMLSWRFDGTRGRDSLDAPVAIAVLYHHHQAQNLGMRLQGEFDKALADLQRRRNTQDCAPRRKKVLDFSPA